MLLVELHGWIQGMLTSTPTGGPPPSRNPKLLVSTLHPELGTVDRFRVQGLGTLVKLS